MVFVENAIHVIFHPIFLWPNIVVENPFIPIFWLTQGFFIYNWVEKIFQIWWHPLFRNCTVNFLIPLLARMTYASNNKYRFLAKFFFFITKLSNIYILSLPKLFNSTHLWNITINVNHFGIILLFMSLEIIIPEKH